MAKVNFKVGTYSQYTSATKDTNTLYFVTDVGKIFKGDDDVTNSIKIVTGFDSEGSGNVSLANAVPGILYLNATTFEIRVKNGAAWLVLSPGYISAGGNYAQATDDSKLGTIGVIKTIIGQAIASIPNVSTDVVFDSTAGTITVGDGQPATLTGVNHSITYDQSSLQLTISGYGVETQVISLPKDNFVQSGRYEENAALPGGGNGPAIVLTVNSGDGSESQEIVIPAASLVDIYTANNTGKNVKITVSSNNEISGEILVDPVAGNALVYNEETGFKVDISSKMNTYGTGTAAEILVSDADGNTVARSTKSIIDGSSDTAVMGDSDTTIPTAKLIAAAIQTAISGVSSDIGSIQTNIDTINSYMVGNGAPDNIITSTATSKIQRSGKTIGSTTLSGDTTGSVVATEAAVAAALSWSQI